jgi:hypothetical protein
MAVGLASHDTGEEGNFVAHRISDEWGSVDVGIQVVLYAVSS